MSRIKVIKRAALQSRVNADETEKISRAAVKPPTGEVVEQWIDEWRASKPKTRGGLLPLYSAIPASASGRLKRKT